MADNKFAKYAAGNKFAKYSSAPAAPQPREDTITPLDVTWGDKLYDFAKSIGLPAQSMRSEAQTVDDTVRAVANGMTFSVADRLAGGFSQDGTAEQRQLTEQARARSPKASFLGEVAGNVATAGGLAKSGLTLMKRPAADFVERMGLMALEGSGYGGVNAAGHGESIPQGMATGYLGGAVAAPVAEGIVGASSKVTDLIKGAVGKGNEPRAYKAIMDALAKSGKTPQQIAQEMNAASNDGQGMYALADALGDPGQRMLSGIVRNGGEKSSQIADALLSRQGGQGERLVNALSEGFGATDTAAQRTASLKASRRTAGDINYGAAKDAAGAVDTSKAISALSEIVSPGLTPMIGKGAADNGVYATLSRMKSLLTNGKAQVSDYQRALLAKQEMDYAMEGGGVISALLRPARDHLDNALAQASVPYAAARDAYRQGSKAIEAVDTGANAASARIRSTDSISQFAGMKPLEQSGFRAGYVDPLIAKIEGTSLSSTTNKARSLVTDKTGAEFPAFALPGKAEQMGNRIVRENQMFKTLSRALGGSKTADNLQDIGNVTGIDTGIIGQLLHGQFGRAAIATAGKAANIVRGRNDKTLELLANALMKTGKDAGAQAFQAANGMAKITDKKQALAKLLALTSVFASQAGQP